MYYLILSHIHTRHSPFIRQNRYLNLQNEQIGVVNKKKTQHSPFIGQSRWMSELAKWTTWKGIKNGPGSILAPHSSYAHTYVVRLRNTRTHACKRTHIHFHTNPHISYFRNVISSINYGWGRFLHETLHFPLHKPIRPPPPPPSPPPFPVLSRRSITTTARSTGSTRTSQPAQSRQKCL